MPPPSADQGGPGQTPAGQAHQPREACSPLANGSPSPQPTPDYRHGELRGDAWGAEVATHRGQEATSPGPGLPCLRPHGAYPSGETSPEPEPAADSRGPSRAEALPRGTSPEAGISARGAVFMGAQDAGSGLASMPHSGPVPGPGLGPNGPKAGMEDPGSPFTSRGPDAPDRAVSQQPCSPAGQRAAPPPAGPLPAYRSDSGPGLSPAGVARSVPCPGATPADPAATGSPPAADPAALHGPGASPGPHDGQLPCGGGQQPGPAVGASAPHGGNVQGGHAVGPGVQQVGLPGLPPLTVPLPSQPCAPWGSVTAPLQVPAVRLPQPPPPAPGAPGGAAAAAAAAAAAVFQAAAAAAATGLSLPPFAALPPPPGAPAAPLPFGVPPPAAFPAPVPPSLPPAGSTLPPSIPSAASVTSAPSAEAPSAEAAAVSGQLQLAAVLRSGGKTAEALALLEGVAARAPGCVEALHQRALCQQSLGQAQQALSSHMHVLALAPDHVPTLLALGSWHQAQGLLGEAVAAFRRAAELAPDDPSTREGLAVVLTDQGTKLKNAGAPVSEAVARYQAAAALCPSYAPALYNLGVVAGELRQPEAAMAYYRAAIAAEPRYAQAHCNLGVLLRERGLLAEAVAAYTAALAAAPNFAIVRNNLAIALTDLGTHVKNEGRLDEGIALYERALSYAPRHADALYNLGVAYGEKGDLQRAAFMYEMALAFNPACAEAHNNLGVIWKEQDNIERAVECYTAALAIRPNFPQSLNNLGVVMTAQGRAAEALALLTAAVAASPSYTEAHNNLGVLQRDVGCIPEALASYSRCLELDPDCRNAGQNRLLALNYIHQGEEDVVCSAHRAWGERFQSRISPMAPLGAGERSRDPSRPLRIGYISPDLFTHSVSYFAEAPLTHHSPERGYTHVVYSCVPRADAKTSRLHAAVEAAGGVWREASGLSEAALAEAVRRDEVDILVELTGHTANNRLGVMARRPAPVQATWIGYPNSTGLAAVDYRFTDEICDPRDTKQTYVEQLVRLPGCFLCYTPAVDAPPVAPPPALSNGFVTFGSFNNLAKITPQVLRVWGAILTSVPRSRLVLKNKPFACEAARQHLLRQLEAVGVEAWRVDLLPLAPGNAQHLAQYALMDISLDPFPYAGTTTTTESLFMGVPCLTLAGRCHAHNVGVSLLTAVGLHPPSATATAAASAGHAAAGEASANSPSGRGAGAAAAGEGSPGGKRGASGGVAASGPGAGAAGGGAAGPGWVAHSEEEYVALAMAHAANVPALTALRSSLRQRMLGSAMCEGPGFVRRLEGVYRALWQRHCAQMAGDEAAAAAAAAAAGL